MKSLAEIRAAALTAGGEPKTLALAASADEEALRALKSVCAAGAVRPLLVGDEGETRTLCRQVGLDPGMAAFYHQPDPAQAAVQAVALVREGRAQLLMKGHVGTADYLRPVVHRETGIRRERLLSVVVALEAPSLGRLLLLTDTGMVIKPDLEEKAAILRNAAWVARRLGMAQPKAAALCAGELVNPGMPDSLDAALLAAMARRGQLAGMEVDGPLALDLAVSEQAARVKGVDGPVAGRADILLMPDIEAGNIAIKALRYLGGLKSGSTVAGATVPIVISSRSDPADIKENSILLALALAGKEEAP